jgi:hypothetical protein
MHRGDVGSARGLGHVDCLAGPHLAAIMAGLFLYSSVQIIGQVARRVRFVDTTNGAVRTAAIKRSPQPDC